MDEKFWRVYLRKKLIAVVKAKTAEEARRKAKQSWLGQWVDEDIHAEMRK